MIRILLLLCTLSASASERTTQELINLVGKKGEITHLYDLYSNFYRMYGSPVVGKDTSFKNVGYYFVPVNLRGSSQIGILFSPYLGYGALDAGSSVVIRPYVNSNAGEAEEFNSFEVWPAEFGAHSSTKRGALLKLHNAFGCDSGACRAIETDTIGASVFGDSVITQGLLKLNAGVQYHGRASTKSEMFRFDDHIVVVAPGGDTLRDTLPPLAIGVGRHLAIEVLAGAAPVIIYAKDTGLKIDGKYRSITLQSNIGESSVEFYNLNTYWKVKNFHERGIWGASLSGDSGTVADTGWYERNGLTTCVTIKPLVGTSNSASLTINGLNSRFTDPSLDTTRAVTAMSVCYNGGNLTTCACAMALNGSGGKCFPANDTTLAFQATGLKGFPKGVNYCYTLDGYK